MQSICHISAEERRTLTINPGGPQNPATVDSQSEMIIIVHKSNIWYLEGRPGEVMIDKRYQIYLEIFVRVYLE